VARETLSLDEAYQIALNNNLYLQAERERTVVAEAGILKAKALPNPKVVSDNGVAEKTYRAGIEQTILLGGKIKKRVSVAKSQKKLTESEVAAKELDLKQNVRRTYTHLYVAQQRQTSLEEIHQLTQKLLTSSQKMEKAGDAPQLDVLQASIVDKMAENELQSNSFELKNLWEQLKTLLNEDISTTTILEKPLLQKLADNVEGLIQSAFSERPELSSLKIMSEIEKYKIDLYKSERIPNLSLTIGPDKVIGSSPNIFGIASFDIPLFNRQQGNIQEANAQGKLYSIMLAAKQQEITQEVKTSFNRLNQAMLKINNYENDLLPASAKITDKSIYGYERGAASILTALNAQQSFVNMKLAYLQSLEDYQNAVTDLERATGRGL
jgi:cobalt-zinc-cadmium efflux system outer membrane protein